MVLRIGDGQAEDAGKKFLGGTTVGFIGHDDLLEVG